MAETKKAKEGSKTKSKKLEEEIEKLKSDIAWLQRQIDDLKSRRK